MLYAHLEQSGLLTVAAHDFRTLGRSHDRRVESCNPFGTETMLERRPTICVLVNERKKRQNCRENRVRRPRRVALVRFPRNLSLGTYWFPVASVRDRNSLQSGIAGYPMSFKACVSGHIVGSYTNSRENETRSPSRIGPRIKFPPISNQKLYSLI